MTPCEMCAKRLVGTKVNRIFYLNNYLNCGDSDVVFTKAKAELISLEDHIKKEFNKIYSKSEYFGKDPLVLVNNELPKFFETNPKLLPDNFMDMIKLERLEGETTYDYFLNIMYEMLYKFVGIEYGKY